MGEYPEDSQPNIDMGDYIYDPVAKIRWMKTPQEIERSLWMNDLEMAIDAYRLWLETKYIAEGEIAFKEALEAFNTFFGEEDYTPGEGISVLETHERMRKRGQL